MFIVVQGQEPHYRVRWLSIDSILIHVCYCIRMIGGWTRMFAPHAGHFVSVLCWARLMSGVYPALSPCIRKSACNTKLAIWSLGKSYSRPFRQLSCGVQRASSDSCNRFFVVLAVYFGGREGWDLPRRRGEAIWFPLDFGLGSFIPSGEATFNLRPFKLKSPWFRQFSLHSTLFAFTSILMRREHVFPSIEWVIARSQPRPVTTFSRFPPFPPFHIPKKHPKPVRRYEPYLWAYSIPSHIRRQRRPRSESIPIKVVNPDARDPNLDKAKDLMECSADTQSMATAKDESELSDEMGPDPGEHTGVSPRGLWTLIKCFLGLLMTRLHHAFAPSSHLQPTSPC